MRRSGLPIPRRRTFAAGILPMLFGKGFALWRPGSLFSPAIESLRDLQRACALDKVRKRLGVNRASLGSLSESRGG